VDDQGTDVDERAAAALRVLREGRAAVDRGPTEHRALLRRLLDETGVPPRRLVRAIAAVAAVAVLGTLTWLAVMPVGTSEGSGGELFAGSAVTEPRGIDGAGGSAPGMATAPSTTAPGIVVHAAGAVRQPGLYRLPRDARVADLLEAAGGPTLETDLDRLNLAAVLADGQRLFVPRKDQVAPPVVSADGGGSVGGGAGGAGGAAAAGPIDLNAATVEQLDTLPGVGPATAAAIVSHRERNGPFASVDGLLDVRGIGPAKLEALRDLVTVG
jgi:competence protein ComEA